MIKRIVYRVFLMLTLLTVVFGLFIYWLLFTESGLKSAAFVAKRIVPGTLMIKNIHGHLAQQIAFDRLIFTHQKSKVDIKQLSLSWSMMQLIKNHTLLIHQINVDDIYINMAKEPQASQSSPYDISIPKPPIGITINNATIKSFSYNHQKITDFTGRIDVNSNKWQASLSLNVLQKNSSPIHISTDLYLSPFAEHTLRLDVNILDNHGQKSQLHVGGTYPDYTIKGHYHGSPEVLLNGLIHVSEEGLKGQFQSQLPKGYKPLSAISMNGQWQYQKSGHFSLTGRLQSQYEQQPLTASININHQSLRANINFVTNHLFINTDDLEHWNFSGQLKNLRALYPEGGNTTANVSFNGKYQYHQYIDITSNDGFVILPKQGLTLKPIKLNLKSAFKEWQLTGVVGLNDSLVHINGTGSLIPSASGQVKVTGNQVVVRNTDDQIIHISPDLLFQFDAQSMSLTGKIDIPKVLIKSPDFEKSQTVSQDVVFDEETAERNALAINLLVALGNDVKISVKGLDATLGGQLQLIQPAGGNLIATGELNVVQGQYQAYGQKLLIDRGRLIFTGGAIDNPGISLRAVRTFNTSGAQFQGSDGIFDFASANLGQLNFTNRTTVGVEVNGRVLDPDISLFSEPPGLSQADILTMLVTGRPANQVGQAGGALLLSAVTSMAPGSGEGNSLLQQLQEKTGLDFNMQDTNTYNSQSNQVTNNKSASVGKAITERLYLSYNVGITSAGMSILTLKYLLNKYLSLQVTAGINSNGLDLLYTKTRE